MTTSPSSPSSSPMTIPLEASPSHLPSLYQTNGHLLLKHLPRGALLTLDGVTLTISSRVTDMDTKGKDFKGFKLIPTGWHSLVVTPVDVGTNQEEDRGATTGMQGLAMPSFYLFYIEAKELIQRQWDEQSNRLIPSSTNKTSDTNTTTCTILTPGLIQSLDSDLTPYPLNATQYSEWTRFAQPFERDVQLTRRVARGMLGDTFTADSLDPVSGGALEDRRRGKRRQGDMTEEEMRLEKDLQRAAKRLGQESVSGSIGTTTAASSYEGGHADHQIRLPAFSLLRSWPEGAIASERTLWSRDKSWALHTAVQWYRDDDKDEKAQDAFLLAFHVLFHLFVSLGSEDLLAAWRHHISLICQSATAIGTDGGVFAAHPSEAEDTSWDPTTRSRATTLLKPGLHARFLDVLKVQLSSLEPTWFSDGGHELEEGIKGDLKTLRGHMSRAMALDARHREGRGHREAEGVQGHSSDNDDESIVIVRSIKSRRPGQRYPDKKPTSPLTSSPQVPNDLSQQPSRQDFEALLSSWRSLSLFVSSTFGWRLDDQTDEEVEMIEEMDEDYQDAVRRAMEEMVAKEQMARQSEDSEGQSRNGNGDGDGDDDDDDDAVETNQF